MAEESVIRVRNAGKCYQIYDRPEDRLKQSLWRGRKQFFREFWALREASFEIGRGETVAIIGRNGSGKSTLLQLIAGTLNPTAGTIDVTGRLAALLELGSGFNPEFTGRENVFLNGAILGLTHREIQQRFDEIAAFAGIGEFIERPVKTYSSGMIVRLAFAVSVCIEPDILIVDEALAVGDMGFQMKCMERLEHLTRNGTTLLFVSHDIYTVKAFCQRAIYLDNGRIKASGSASDMVELYLLDLRDAQRQAGDTDHAIRIKPGLNAEKGLAFGTNQGRIIHAEFADGGDVQSSFSSGETVRLRLTLEFDDSVRHPALSVVIHDHRMVDLAGHYFMIDAGKTPCGLRRTAFEVSFPANLNSGQFFITLRLEDRRSDTSFFPIDKQVAVLGFHILRPGNSRFIGLVSLPFEAKQDTHPPPT